MKKIKTYIKLLLILYSIQCFAGDSYQPGSGDEQLDKALITLNNKITKQNRNKFSSKLSVEFQVPVEKVEELFRQYEFTAGDVLLSLSIADLTGQPLNNISRAYFENKQQGWKYTLDQLEIIKGTGSFEQLRKDAATDFLK